MNNASKPAAAVFILLLLLFTSAFLFTSCETEDSKLCRKVTYNNGELENTTDWVEYSGWALDNILDMEDVKIGDRITRWECK